MKKDVIYDRYTTTCALTENADKNVVTKLSKTYFIKHFEKFLPSDKKAKILDIGCGYGRYIKVLLEMGYTNCYGIDISEEQILHASRSLGLTNVEKADALQWLSGKESMFDCILVLDILEHLSQEELLDLGGKMYTALKPGGKIIIQVPNGLAPLNPYLYGDLTHRRAYTPQSLGQFLLCCGLISEGYYEIAPTVHSVETGIRRILWTFVLKPAVKIFMILAHGTKAGGIYTANILAVGKRSTCTLNQGGEVIPCE